MADLQCFQPSSMDKNALRNMLDQKSAEFKQSNNVTVYAGNPNPERKNAIPRSRNYRSEEYDKYVQELKAAR
jgi:ribosomal protein L13